MTSGASDGVGAVPLDDGPLDHGRTTLPWCSFRARGTGGDGPRVGVGLERDVVDLAAAVPELSELLSDGTLDALLALGAGERAEVRSLVIDAAELGALEPHRVSVDAVDLLLPWTVRDYVDFYASEHHATNVGRILRPDGEPLTPNWKHLPIGYHGRAGTVVVSGTEVARPCGQLRDEHGEVSFGPTRRLDLEAEVGFVVAGPAVRGPVPLAEAERHLFGVCLVNDWSARDLQAWEYAPLGPFLGKSFATSVSPWVIPIEALDAARIPPPTRQTPLLDYLDDSQTPAGGFDLALEVRVGEQVISRPPFAAMYWTPAQMLAHLSVNGASVRPGDLFASGTVSGADPEQWGSLMELTHHGDRPLRLSDGSELGYLRDGDTVTVSATAAARDGSMVRFGEVTGRIVPPRGAGRSGTLDEGSAGEDYSIR